MPIPDTCACSITTINAKGEVVPLGAVDLQVVALPAGYAVPLAVVNLFSDANGLLVVNLIRGAKYRASTLSGRIALFTVPDADTFTIPSIIGSDELTQADC